MNKTQGKWLVGTIIGLFIILQIGPQIGLFATVIEGLYPDALSLPVYSSVFGTEGLDLSTDLTSRDIECARGYVIEEGDAYHKECIKGGRVVYATFNFGGELDYAISGSNAHVSNFYFDLINPSYTDDKMSPYLDIYYNSRGGDTKITYSINTPITCEDDQCSGTELAVGGNWDIKYHRIDLSNYQGKKIDKMYFSVVSSKEGDYGGVIYTVTLNKDIAGETTTPSCTESNWQSSISPLTCPSSGIQTRTWTKVGNCEGGISHTSGQITCVPGEIEEEEDEEIDEDIEDDEDEIPEDEPEPSFWEQYMWWIIGAIGLFVLLLASRGRR